MAHLPRFHRRKKEVAPPTLITSDLQGNKTTTPATTTNNTTTAHPPPGDLLPSGSPMRSLRGLSPFRVFHRASGKRARDSPPASLPHSPVSLPVLALDCADGRPVSPLSLKTDPAGDDAHKPAAQAPQKPHKMPAFLDQTPEEILHKFSELVWRERNRLSQSAANPSPDFRWARVPGHQAKALDRYMNVQPWHNNRVKLRVPEGRLDYINASPITLAPSACVAAAAAAAAEGTGGCEPDRYIAMQGPKQNSADHVWRMVVEQLDSPCVMVMLTETHEGHLEKCYPYFPRSPADPPLEVNERDEFGDGFRATVRCEAVEETPAGDAIELRRLVVRVHPPSPPSTKKSSSPIKSHPPTPTSSTSSITTPIDSEPASGPPSPSSAPPPQQQQKQQQDQPPVLEEKTVYHFLYKKWPDFGVPALADLPSFFALMRLSRARNAHPANPRVVHCSAGVGRSGTFVALEHLARELAAGAWEGWDEKAAAAAAAEKMLDGVGAGEGEGEAGDAERGRREKNGSGGKEKEKERRGARSLSRGRGRGGRGAGASTDAAAPPVPSLLPRSAASSLSSTSSGSGSISPVPGQGEDVVFETVDRLREQRRTMVQAEAQYLFIYQVLRKMWVDKYGDGSSAGEEMEVDGLDGEDDHDHDGHGYNQGGGGGDGDETDGSAGEPAAKRLEVDPSFLG